MINLFWLLLWLLGCIKTRAMELTDLIIPEVVDFRDNVTLTCRYDMGNRELNSVKWYKDGMEFFRYSPMGAPSVLQFNVDGVANISDMHNCNKGICSIHLDNLRQKSSGAYRCEISGDAPEFKLISQTRNMTIAALPQRDPIIRGLSTGYKIGDFLMGNCTSEPTSPPATLSWYIDNDIVRPDYLEPQHETSTTSNGFVLRSRSQDIHFRIDEQLAQKSDNGKVKLKCIAHIDKLPSETRQKEWTTIIHSDEYLRNSMLINSADRFTSFINNIMKAEYLGTFFILSVILWVFHL